jgi:hypothetical protein
MAENRRPKAHHKVSRFHIEGVRNDGTGTGKRASVWVYRRGEQQPRQSNPGATGFETNFYSLISPDGFPDASLEQWFADHVDSPVHDVWPRLVDSVPVPDDIAHSLESAEWIELIDRPEQLGIAGAP